MPWPILHQLSLGQNQTPNFSSNIQRIANRDPLPYHGESHQSQFLSLTDTNVL